MGFFSEYSLERFFGEDQSYPSVEIQLRCRIEDLQNRLTDLLENKAACDSGQRFSIEDLHYASPNAFLSGLDISAAISVAEKKLSLIEEAQYAVQQKDAINLTNNEIPGQLTIWEWLQEETTTVFDPSLKSVA